MGLFKKKSADHAMKELVDGLAGALGPTLVSVLLYGSKASGEFREGHSNINLFILLADASTKTLTTMRPFIKAWIDEGHVMPVFMPQSELALYADSLPIEFLDMQDHHRVIFGADPLQGLVVGNVHLRAQCVMELSIKLLKLRQALVMVGADSKKLRTILLSFLPGILTLYRAGLRLEAAVGSKSKMDATKEFAGRAGIEVVSLERLWEFHARRQSDNLEMLAQDMVNGLEHALVYLQRK